MPRRYHDSDYFSSEEIEPPRKKSSNVAANNNTHFNQGELITDISGTQWNLGKTVGIGGFGEIYEASKNAVKSGKTDNEYVAKIEKHTSGPLFVEINCYLRIGKSEMVEEWKKEKQLEFLGMPHYVASGSCYHNDEKYRFLLLPKYNKDLDQILQEKKLFNIKTVCNICIQILDVLEYIHSKGYIHSDIKASNIMLGTQEESSTKIMEIEKQFSHRRLRKCKPPKRDKPMRNLRPLNHINYSEDYLDNLLNVYENSEAFGLKKSEEQIEIKREDRAYLVDFGLASKYKLSNGDHKEFSPDVRRAHAGTVLFCSRDAHKGIQSRRSDLESLAYNMVYWLTGLLPWIEDIEQPNEVEVKKNRCFNHLKKFLSLCFNDHYPDFVLEYFEYLEKLQFEDDPDYTYCRRIFKKAIKLYGYNLDCNFDFDNLEGWGIQKKMPLKANKKITHHSFLRNSPLRPLNSNIIFKRPKLRKQLKNIKVQDSLMNWSKLLIVDPETIIKQSRERKTTESSDSETLNWSSLDLYSLNPTYAMIDVYNKCVEREDSPKHKIENDIDNIEGYTQAMMSVYIKMQENKELEKRNSNVCQNGNNKRRKKVNPKKSDSLMDKNLRTRSKNGRKINALPSPKKSKTIFKRNYSLRG